MYGIFWVRTQRVRKNLTAVKQRGRTGVDEVLIGDAWVIDVVHRRSNDRRQNVQFAEYALCAATPKHLLLRHALLVRAVTN